MTCFIPDDWEFSGRMPTRIKKATCREMFNMRPGETLEASGVTVVHL